MTPAPNWGGSSCLPSMHPVYLGIMQASWRCQPSQSCSSCFLVGRTAEHVQREAAQPVLAHVVAAADTDQPDARVPVGRLEQDGAPPIVRRQRLGDAPETPGPAQVEPVQVDDL